MTDSDDVVAFVAALAVAGGFVALVVAIVVWLVVAGEFVALVAGGFVSLVVAFVVGLVVAGGFVTLDALVLLVVPLEAAAPLLPLFVVVAYALYRYQRRTSGGAPT